MPCRRQSSVSFAPASYSLTIPIICSSVNRLVRICPPPERRSNRFSLSVAPFQGAGSGPLPKALLRAPPVHRLAAGGRGAAPDRRALRDRGRDPRPPRRGATGGPTGTQQAARGGIARLAHGPAGAGLGQVR